MRRLFQSNSSKKAVIFKNSLFYQLFKLNIQIFDIFCVGFDEFPARSYFISHQNRKGFVCPNRILQFYFFHNPGFRVHGRFPQLFRIHFPKAFIALYVLFHIVAAIQLLYRLIPFFVRIGIENLFSAGYLVKRRLGQINMPFFDQRPHETGRRRSKAAFGYGNRPHLHPP